MDTTYALSCGAQIPPWSSNGPQLRGGSVDALGGVVLPTLLVVVTERHEATGSTAAALSAVRGPGNVAAARYRCSGASALPSTLDRAVQSAVVR